MKYILDKDFLIISTRIKLENKTEDEWALVESSDMFQEGKYVGGFDAIEMAFTFSIYENGKEYWFQLTLNEIDDVVEGRKSETEVVEADI